MATGSYGRYAGYIFDPVSIYIYPEPCGIYNKNTM